MQDEQTPAQKRASTFPLFSKNMLLQPLNAVEFSHGMRRHFEDYIDAFRRRIEIEMIYSRSLEAVSKQLDKYIKPGTEKAISFISSAFKVQHEQRAHQAKELAESIKTEIQDICAQLWKNQTTSVKKIEKDVKRYYKEASNLEENYARAFENYEGRCKQAEEMIITKNIMKYTTGIPQDKKLKLITKTIEGIRENKEQEKNYSRAIREYNEFASMYNKEVAVELDTIESQVREQIILEADCMRKLIVCQISMFKNIQYDLISISKQMEALDTQRDVEILADQSKNAVSNFVLPIFEEKQPKDQTRKQDANSSAVSTGSNGKDSPLKLQAKQPIGKSMLNQSLLYIEEEYFNLMLSLKKSKMLRSAVEMIWKKLKNQRKNYDKGEQTTKQGIAQSNGVEQSRQTTENNGQGNGAEQIINGEPQEILFDKDRQKNLEKNKDNAQTQTKEKVEYIQVNVPLQNNEPLQVNEASGFQQINRQQPKKVQVEVSLNEAKMMTQPLNVDLTKQTYSIKEIKQLLQQFLNSYPIAQSPSSDKAQQPVPTREEILTGFFDITQAISKLWNYSSVNLSENMQPRLDLLSKYFSKHHVYRLLGFIFIEEYRIQQEVLLQNVGCARSCGKILRIILTESLKKTDVFIMRGILGLLFTFYWQDDSGKKLLYQNIDVYQCKVWKKPEFWAAAIFQTTYEQMSQFTPQKGETQAETVFREKNLIFSQLASFCHYMIMLGITHKNVRTIVGRYCRMYEMSDDQNMDLSKMITNTNNQYKQILNKLTAKGEKFAE